MRHDTVTAERWEGSQSGARGRRNALKTRIKKLTAANTGQEEREPDGSGPVVTELQVVKPVVGRRVRPELRFRTGNPPPLDWPRNRESRRYLQRSTQP